jgi:preprotein translocase subunit SecG
MNILLTIHIFITLALVGVILIQKTDSSGGLLGGGGGGGSMFTARGAANLLTRITAVLAALFIGNCILMTIVTKNRIQSTAAFLDTQHQTPQQPASNNQPTSNQPTSSQPTNPAPSQPQ